MPAIVPKNMLEDIIEAFSGIRIEDQGAVQTGDIDQVFFYRIPEEKKHFDILTARKCIQDM